MLCKVNLDIVFVYFNFKKGLLVHILLYMDCYRFRVRIIIIIIYRT